MSALGDLARRLTLWPSVARLNAKIGCWGELGRILHWVGAAVASNFLVIGLTAPLWAGSPDVLWASGLCVLIAVIIYLPARLLRKLMAGE